MEEEVENSNELTVFAPTNFAFDQLAVNVENENKACLKELVSDHFVDEIFCSSAAGKLENLYLWPELKTIKVEGIKRS